MQPAKRSIGAAAARSAKSLTPSSLGSNASTVISTATSKTSTPFTSRESQSLQAMYDQGIQSEKDTMATDSTASKEAAGTAMTPAMVAYRLRQEASELDMLTKREF